MKNLQGVKRLIIYLRKRKGKLSIILLMAVVVSVLELFPAQIVGRIIDMVAAVEMSKIIMAILLFGVVYFLSSIIQIVYGNMVTDYSNKIIEDVRTDLFSSVINRDVHVSDQDSTGDIVTRATSDVEQIVRVVAGPLNGFLGKILVFFFSLIVLGMISIRLSLVTVLISGLLYYLSKDISVKNKENGEDERRHIGITAQKMTDALSNILLIKSYGTEKQEVDELKEQSDCVYQCRKKLLGHMRKYWSCVELCNGLGYVLAFLFAVYEIRAGHCPAGQVVVIYSYLQMIFSSMISVSRYKTDIYHADAALARTFLLIPENVEEDRMQSGILDYGINKIKVENLTLCYEDQVVVQDIFFELEKGKLVVLVGESGRGKSSILYGIMGFMDIFAGKIFFDDMDVTGRPDIRRHSIRMAFQEPFLFQRTIEENLQYGGAEDNWCDLFCGIGVKKIIEQGEKGRILDATNKSLSGGEQRRLSLYRNVNKKVACYLFDEPTAELDAYNKEQVINALLKLKEEAMVLVVTHDEGVMDAADVLVRF